jgi:hypothetical protein
LQDFIQMIFKTKLIYGLIKTTVIDCGILDHLELEWRLIDVCQVFNIRLNFIEQRNVLKNIILLNALNWKTWNFVLAF